MFKAMSLYAYKYYGAGYYYQGLLSAAKNSI